MTTYDPAAVKALIVAAEQVLLSGEDADGTWMHVSRWRVEPLRAAVKAVRGAGGQETSSLRNAAAVHCNCGGFFTFDGCSFVHADHCERPRR